MTHSCHVCLCLTTNDTRFSGLPYMFCGVQCLYNLSIEECSLFCFVLSS